MAKENQGINPLGAAITGAALGAAAVALSKKENRDKLRRAVQNIKKDADKKMETFHSQVDKLQDKGEDLVEDTMEMGERVIESNTKMEK